MFPFKASFHHSKKYLKLKWPLPALFTWETGQKETWSSPPSNFSKLQPLILCKFIYSKQQHKQFFFPGSAAYWININHQRRRGWKEDGSPFSQRLIFFFKAKTHRHKHEAIYHGKGSTWKSQLKTGHSQDCPGSLKSRRISFYSRISLWCPVSLITSLFKAHLKNSKHREGRFWRRGNWINASVYYNDFLMAFSALFTYFDVFKVGKVHQRPLWLEAKCI